MMNSERFAGAEEWQTGGGCRAYVLTKGHYYVMITEEGGCDLPGEEDKHVSLGLYVDEDYDEIDIDLGPGCLFSAGDVSVLNVRATISMLLEQAPMIHLGARLI